ncbi:MAG: LptF/LptG family permease [Phycisphaerae bacterium]
MSRTLFWYIFKDLLKVFLLTGGVLTGIMSFGGLLKPLTKYGLDASQVGQMLAYFTPAMLTYSLPVSALFATTFVFGRLAADNEITACRAAGISFPMLTFPAVIMGLLISLVSVLLLCFVVPAAILRAERVIYANLGSLVTHSIERSNKISFDAGVAPVTIFAGTAFQPAVTEPPPPGKDRQVVAMQNVSIITYDRTNPDLPVPGEIYTAREAVVWLTRPLEDDYSNVEMSVQLTDGSMFPRTVTGTRGDALIVDIGATQFGPYEVESPLRENTKFLDIRRLQEVKQDPTESARVSRHASRLVRERQREAFIAGLLERVQNEGQIVLEAAGGTIWRLDLLGADAEQYGSRLFARLPDDAPPMLVMQDKPGQAPTIIEARQLSLAAAADPEFGRIYLNLSLVDTVVRDGGGEPYARRNPVYTLSVDMPADVLELEGMSLEALYGHPGIAPGDKRTLRRNEYKTLNSVIGEIHSRASFSVSCLVLTVVGSMLGMMFRSGNFLSAFAVSSVPALLTVMLIVTGQHACEDVYVLPNGDVKNVVPQGLALIWGGNAVVAMAGAAMLWRLARR